MVKKAIIYTLLIVVLASCNKYWYKPYSKIFNHKPEGSPGFELGWMHGCESGLGTQFGGAFMMTFDDDVV